MSGAEVAVVNAATLPDRIRYAQALAESGLLPAHYRGKPANVLYAVEYGAMLGLPPMAAITGVHVIEGKPSASASLIGALVRRAGHRLRVTGDSQSATAEIVRADDPDFTFSSTWTMDRARQASLASKDVWKKYPASMLKARAITEAARDACEEALSGVHYTPEELGAVVNEDGDPVAHATPAPPAEPESVPDYRAQAKAAETVEAVQDVWRKARAANHLDQQMGDDLMARAREIEHAQTDVVDAEIVEPEQTTIDTPEETS